MTKTDLHKALDDLGVEYGSRDTIAVLEKALKKAEKKAEKDAEKDTETETEEEVEPEKLSSEETKEEARIEPKPEAESEEEEGGDYLRQYQFKMVNNLPTVGGVLTDPDKGSKAERMKEHLLAQPKVRIMVPRKEGESRLHKVNVTLNGYRLDFEKNMYVGMPKQVAELIMKSQAQTDAALSQFLLKDAKGEALNG